MTVAVPPIVVLPPRCQLIVMLAPLGMPLAVHINCALSKAPTVAFAHRTTKHSEAIKSEQQSKFNVNEQ